MYPIAWDTETALAGPAQQAPPLVCASFKHEGGELLLHRTEAKPLFDQIVYDDGYLLVGHNIFFDLAVIAEQWPEYLRPIFQAVEEGRVRDTMIRQKLLDIAIGRYRGFWEDPTEEQIEKAKKKALKEDKPFVMPPRRWVKVDYTLSTTHYRFTGRRLRKDEWQLKYRRFMDTPIDEWPEGAKKYALDDARSTYRVYVGQENAREHLVKQFKRGFRDLKDPDPLGDEDNQVRYAWWIHLMRCWGIRTDPKRVAKLRNDTEEAYTVSLRFLQTTPICSKCGRLMVRRRSDNLYSCEIHQRSGEMWTLVRPNKVRNTEAAKKRMEFIMGGKDNCRLTDKGNISLDEEACTLSEDELLKEYSALTSLQNVLSKDIPALLSGVQLPVHSNFNSLLATGRTSSSKPNIQNIRRLPGIRECFVPRKGMVFLNADYDGLELRTLAQTCLKLFKRSKLAEVLNAGEDPHLQVAAAILKISYKEAKRRYKAKDPEVGRARQFGKIANFGFPGGLGYEALILFAKRSTAQKGKKGIELTLEDAMELKENWLLAFPEMELYFDHINIKCRQHLYDDENLATIQQLFTRRIRGKIRFTVACNTYFQGLGSDATKNAGWLITKACYLDEDSPLYGCRLVNYVHDEFILECPEERAHAACMELKRLMIEGASPYLPDVPPTVKYPLVARCWSKDAEQVWEIGKEESKHLPANDQDRLVPWDPDLECPCPVCVEARKKAAA